MIRKEMFAFSLKIKAEFFLPWFISFNNMSDPVTRAAKQLRKNKRTRSATEPTPANKRQKTGDTVATTKAKRNSRSIPFNEDQVPVISKFLGCTITECPLTGYTGLYSALTQEPTFAYTYPVLLEAPVQKKKLKKPSHKTICGTTRPEIVISVLIKAFGVLFPNMEAQRVQDWDVYKWNQAYYGSGVASRAPQWSDLEKKLSEHRALGGHKNAIQVNVFNEASTNKAGYAIDLADLFPERKTLPRSYLVEMRDRALQLAENEDLLVVDKGKLEKHVSAQEEDSSDDENESDSEEDQQ